MAMDLQSLIEGLERFKPRCRLSSNPRISSVRIQGLGRVAPDDETLYISGSADVELPLPRDKQLNIIIASETPPDLEIAGYPNLNLILLSGARPEALLGELQGLILAPSLREAQRLLFQALIQDAGLDGLIETASDVIGNPLVLCDLNYKNLSYTKSYPVKDKYWDEMVNIGFQAKELVSIVKLHDVIKNLYIQKHPYYLPKELDLSNTALMCMPIRVQNKVVASLGLVAFKRPFRKEDETLFELIAKTIAAELQKNHYYFFQKDVRLESFLKDLLDGSMRSKALIEERMKYLDWETREYFFILVISVDQMEHISDLLVYFRERMNDTFGNSKSVVYNERIVTIIDSPHQFFPKSETYSRLSDFLEKSDFYAGISRGFKDLSETTKYYEQAMNALNLGTRFRKHARLSGYDDVVIYHFMDMCFDQVDIKAMCNPALFTLMQYDSQYKTNYLKTLYTYIACFTNRQDAAKALAIHYNTLKYRLMKIHDLTNVDINSKSEILNLSFSFEVLDFLGMEERGDFVL